MMLFFYLASLAATAMHPAGFVLGVLAVGSFLWFAVALGTYVSLRSKGANQVIGRAVLILLAVNLAPVAAFFPLVGGSSLMISTPMLLVVLPMSRMQFVNITRAVRIEPAAGLVILAALGVVLAHAVAAWILTRAAAGRIERDVE